MANCVRSGLISPAPRRLFKKVWAIASAALRAASVGRGSGEEADGLRGRGREASGEAHQINWNAHTGVLFLLAIDRWLLATGY